MPTRTVLTTGANSGIGLATVVELARRGFRSVGSVRSEAKAEVVARAAHDAGVEVDTVELDVTDADRCAEVVAELEPWGLVNNAGYSLTGAIEDVSDAEAQALFETMVHAPMRLARLALPAMRREGGGRIVNVSSVTGRTTAPFVGHYAGAKHALEALSDALRIEVAADGVRVVLIEPGGFKTGIWDEVESDIERRERDGTRHGDAYRRSLRGQQLIEALMGNPTTVARVVGTALTSPVPLARYLVGLDAAGLVVTQTLTPTSLRDRLIRLGLGL